MTQHTKERLENMLEDVVNELELSADSIREHGQNGTPPAELVRLVLDEKNNLITRLLSQVRHRKGSLMSERERQEYERWKDERDRLAEKQECSDFGFEPLIAEPSNCEKCGTIGTVYFGNQTYFEPLDGEYMCASCVMKRCKVEE